MRVNLANPNCASVIQDGLDYLKEHPENVYTRKPEDQLDLALLNARKCVAQMDDSLRGDDLFRSPYVSEPRYVIFSRNVPQELLEVYTPFVELPPPSGRPPHQDDCFGYLWGMDMRFYHPDATPLLSPTEILIIARTKEKWVFALARMIP